MSTVVRPRLPHARRDRGDDATARSSACASTCSPTTARSTTPRNRRSSRPGSSTSSPARYDLDAAHCKVNGVYTNKAPGGVAYALLVPGHRGRLPRRAHGRLPRRRAGDGPGRAAHEEPASRPSSSRTRRTTGWEYDSGDYAARMRLAMDIAGYEELRREQAEKRARGELMGIGVSFFTETVGAGPRKHMDILGLGMADGAELRVHPTGKAVVRIGARPRARVTRRRSPRSSPRSSASRPRTSRSSTATPTSTPFGLGTYGSRSTPVSGRRGRGRLAAGARQGAASIASAMLEVSPDDLEWEKGRWFVKGDPVEGPTIQEIALRATRRRLAARGRRGPPRRDCVYDPPNLTYPFGAYICVVDVDPGTGQGEGAALHRGRRLRRRASTR